MAHRCPQCDAPSDGAPWCGACGARLAAAPTTASRAAADGRGASSGDERPWRRRLTVAVVLAAVGSLLLLGGRGERPRSGPSAAGDVPIGTGGEVVPPVLLPDRPSARRQFASRGGTLWARSDLASPPRAQDVRAAGAEHVLVGRRLLSTGLGTVDDPLRTVPAPAVPSAYDDDGRWAVAEFGRVVLGGTTTAVTTIVADGWQPTGPAVAWHGGAPVLADHDGRLGLLADGVARWRTAEPVAAAGPVGDRWLAGVRQDGSPVAVGLADGRVVGLPAPALAIHGDRAVTRPGDVVAVDLLTGAEAWRRAATGASWRALDGGFVAEGPRAAVLVDPATGTDRARVEGTGALASDEVVLVRGPEGIEAISWSGGARWRLRLDDSATVLAVDGTRVAVRAAPPAGARVTVFDASTGLVLTDAVLPAALDRRLAVGDDELWVVESGDVVAVVDRRTGADVDGTAVAPPPGSDLRFGSQDTTVTVAGGVATLRGTRGDVTLWTVPFGSPLAVAPTRAGTSVLVLLADGTVAVLDPRTGAVRWRCVLAVVPTAAASDGVVLLVGTSDGQVLRLDPSGEVVTRTAVGSGRVEALAAGRPAAALVSGRLVGIDIDGTVPSP